MKTKYKHSGVLRRFSALFLIFIFWQFALAASTLTDLTTQVKGILPVLNGGSGTSTATGSAGNLVLSSGPTIANLITTGDITMGQQSPLYTLPNDTTTGTTVNLLAKITSTGKAIVLANTDTGGSIGIVTAGAGTTGSASITTIGIENCVADNSTTIGHYLGLGTTTGGRCKDVGATRPTSGQVIGFALSAVTAGSNVSVLLFGTENVGAATFNFADDETPSGSINGSNVTFTLAHTPSPGASLSLFKNGQKLEPGGADYSLSTNTITATVAPKTGDTLTANYRF